MSIGLTAAELTAIRADINDLLPGTCNILTITVTSDGEAGFSESWGTASSNVACRLDPIKMREWGIERVTAGAMQAFHQYMLTLPYTATIDTANRVEVGTVTYNVISVDTNKSWNASVRAVVERLTNV